MVAAFISIVSAVSKEILCGSIRLAEFHECRRNVTTGFSSLTTGNYFKNSTRHSCSVTADWFYERI